MIAMHDVESVGMQPVSPSHVLLELHIFVHLCLRRGAYGLQYIMREI